MNVEPQEFPISDLVNSLESGQLLRNSEYQRGEAWSPVQKAGFIDSIFRKYPVPAIFLHERQAKGLGGVVSSKWEVVDGQQRLTALRDFVKGRFPLLPTDENSKLRLPKALRSFPAPWAGRLFDQLTEVERNAFLGTKIHVFLIKPDAHPDEIRDLFIRLQSGTALSRQQVRDAWPGSIGPFIETLAGKLDKRPTHKIFSVIDRRGVPTEDEDQRDQYVADRQVCAQLLKVFLAREFDPNAFPAVSAKELDALYHEFTDFEIGGRTAERFKDVLDRVTETLEVTRSHASKAKFRRLEVTALMMYVQDTTRNPLFKFDRTVANTLGGRMSSANRDGEPVGKKASGNTLQQYYLWWRENIAQNVGIYLDPERLFSDEKKTAIWRRDNGECQVCKKNVVAEEAEYDHYPIPYRDGGKTVVENGRLVHRVCHERGRPAGV